MINTISYCHVNLLPTVSHFSGFCKQVYILSNRVAKSHRSTRNLCGSKELFKCNAHVNFYGYTLQYEPNKRPWNTLKRICSQKHAIIQTDYRVIQRCLPPSFFVQLCAQRGNGRLDIIAAEQRQTGLAAQLRSKAYAVLFLSRLVRATIVANSG